MSSNLTPSVLFRQFKLIYSMNTFLKFSLKNSGIFLILSLNIFFTGCNCLRGKDVLFQVSSIDALLAGDYDGRLSLKELKKNGDLGLGTFAALDGEMLGFDGKFYQVRSDGSVYEAEDNLFVPFAAVTFFEADKKIRLEKIMDFGQLQAYLDSLIPSKNIFYALRITGDFSLVKVRSVPKQNKPYPLLEEVLKTQPVFELRNCKGTMVGFRSPSYAQGINVPGYHFHFIALDKKAGGHVLELETENVTIEIDYTPRIFILLE